MRGGGGKRAGVPGIDLGGSGTWRGRRETGEMKSGSQRRISRDTEPGKHQFSWRIVSVLLRFAPSTPRFPPRPNHSPAPRLVSLPPHIRRPHAARFSSSPLHQQEKTPSGAFSPSILFVLFVPFAINNRSYSSRCRNTKQNHPQHHLRAVSRIRALLCLFQVEYRICLTFI